MARLREAYITLQDACKFDTAFTITPIPELQHYCQAYLCFNNSEKLYKDEELYALSLQREPRATKPADY